jgi:hypothetical protein
MSEEVTAGRDRRVDADVLVLVVVHVASSREESVDVGRGLLDVALDVHGEARGLGEGEAEVEGDSSGNGAESDEEPPAEVQVVRVWKRGCQLLSRPTSEDENAHSWPGRR